MMNLTLFHQLTFVALYIALALTCFVAVERFIFYTATWQRTRRLADALVNGGPIGQAQLGKGSLALHAYETVQQRLPGARSRHDVEDLSEEVYIDARTRLSRHLWVLDTIVTASPLLGLLGTILGIIDTFTALARSGISDPAGVSAGIGSALFATALGIAVALFSLFFFNLFQERIERLSDQMKIVILRLTAHSTV